MMDFPFEQSLLLSKNHIAHPEQIKQKNMNQIYFYGHIYPLRV